MTFDELRQLDFGKWKSPEYEGEKIPTIEEVLDIGKDMKMMHIELKPYLDRDADFPERVIDAVVNAHMEDKVILTSFQYGLLGRIKEIRPEIRTAALFLNTESSLCPPTALWEDLGLTNGDPLLEELSGPQGLEKAVSIVENPDSVDEENGLLVRYLNDRLTALSSNYPGKNLVEILQQYYYQTDMLKYVSQFDFRWTMSARSTTSASGTPPCSSARWRWATMWPPGPWATRAAGTCAVSSSRTRRSS